MVNFSSERGRGEGKEMRYTVKIGTGYYSGSITRSIGLGWGVQSVHFSFVFRSPPHLGRARGGYLAGHHICCIWRAGNRVGFFDGAGCAMHAKRDGGFRAFQDKRRQGSPFAEGYLLLLLCKLVLRAASRHIPLLR